MGHTITMGLNGFTGKLNLIYINQNGSLQAFSQNAQGQWFDASTPSNPPQTSCKYIVEIGPTLYALDQNGQLWSSMQDNKGNWPAFQPVAPQAGLTFVDIAAAEVPSLGVLICALNSNGTVYVQLTSSRFVATKLYGPQIAAGVSALGSAVVLGATSNIEINFINGIYSSDGTTWNPANLGQPALTNPILAALAPGSGGQLQAVVLAAGPQYAGGQPNICSDTSGWGSTWTSPSPLPAGTTQLSMAAAATGSNGNLQVVGINAADGQPYVIEQQATTGNWIPGKSLPMNSGVPPITDLCTGMGNQNYLQVGYMAGGKVYVNWQDSKNNWGWFGPLPGLLYPGVGTGPGPRPTGPEFGRAG